MGQQAQGGVAPQGGAAGKGGRSPYYQQNPFQTSAGQLGQAGQGMSSALNYQPMMIDPGQFGRIGGGGGGSMGNIWGAPRDYSYDPAAAQGLQGQAPGYESALLRDTNLSPYMNPYTNQVINTSLADMDRQRQAALNNTGAQAQAAGAYGGGRHGVMEGITNAESIRDQAQLAAQLRNQGFQNAQRMALTDIGNQNQASQFSLSNEQAQRLANLQNEQFNTQAQNAASQFEQEASLREALQRTQTAGQVSAASTAANASMRNAMINAQLRANLANQQAHQTGAQFRLGAANNMSNLGLQNFQIGNAVQQGNRTQGAFERGINQGILDRAGQSFEGHRQAPYQNIDMLNSIFNPGNQGEESSQPGLMDWLGTAIQAYGAYAIASGSDRRLKEDITPIGQWRGHNLYTWKWTEEAQNSDLPLGPEVGVIAQEVARTRPDAVVELSGGFLGVNYGAL